MRQITEPVADVHLFVCINDRSSIPDNTTPSCCPTIKLEDVKAVKQWIRESGLVATVYCTATRCMGFCNTEGGIARIFPSGRIFKGIHTTEELKSIVVDEIGRAA